MIQISQPLVPQEVINIVNETRRWAETIAEDEEYPSNLCGLCARVSSRLFTSLEREGYHSSLCYTRKHTFILFNETIIDVTASQFFPYRTKAVLIKPLIEATDSFHMNYQKFDDLESFISHLISEGWPSDQISQDDDYGIRIY